MSVFAVFVYCTIPGYHSRWIDSQWANSEAADERCGDLSRVLDAFNVSFHSIHVIELKVIDMKIAAPASANLEVEP